MKPKMKRMFVGHGVLLSASLVLGIGLAGCATGGGGGGGGGPQDDVANDNGVVVEITISNETYIVDLTDDFDEFEVEAGGEPRRQTAPMTLFTGTPTDRPSRGNLTLDAADIEARPIRGGDTQGLTGLASLRALLAHRDAEDAFEDGTEVGTFRIRLEEGRATVENPSLELPEAALERARTGSCVLGLEALSDVDVGLTVRTLQIVFDPEEPADENENVSENENGGGEEPLTTFDGHWYSPDHEYSFRIEGLVGVATLSNAPAVYQEGDTILHIDNVDGQTFTGRTMFTDGSWRDVSGELVASDQLRLVGGGFDWVMYLTSSL